MPYIADDHQRPSSDELRARIPGWGADLDHANRPSVPKERTDLETGAHWVIPERQAELSPRERSVEHGMLPPVFGTTAPLHGVSGLIRGFAYKRFGEGQTAHWMLLVLGDRVDVAGARIRAVREGRPDNPITETGLAAELHHHAVASRVGLGRADTKHMWLDPLLIVGPIALIVFGLIASARRGTRRA